MFIGKHKVESAEHDDFIGKEKAALRQNSFDNLISHLLIKLNLFLCENLLIAALQLVQICISFFIRHFNILHSLLSNFILIKKDGFFLLAFVLNILDLNQLWMNIVSLKLVVLVLDFPKLRIVYVGLSQELF
jgi:hypothetical protein